MKSFAILLVLVTRAAAADPMDFSGAEVEHRRLGDIEIERRALIGVSGYTQLQLAAVVNGTRTILVEDYVMCDAVKRTPSGLVVDVCVERHSDTVESTEWRFARGALTRGKSRLRSPYLDAAKQIVRDLRGGAPARAAARLTKLGDMPDGQDSIAWWWEAQWLWAEHGRGVRNRIERILEIEGGVASLLAADLGHVPHVGIDDVVVHGIPPAISTLLDDAVTQLGRGSANDRAAAVRLQQALADARRER